jgi:hypothetical protein
MLRFLAIVRKMKNGSVMGIEAPANSPDHSTLSTVGGAKSGAFSTSPEIDPVLSTIIAAWPRLPEPVRAGIVAMVKASAGPDKV